MAKTQEAYESAVRILFASLDRVEQRLSSHPGPYYYGASITEADVRLYVTIIRFDPVYHGHFKCNIRDIRSGYPAIHKWLRKLYHDVPAFKETTQFEHIKGHYMKSHITINPFVRFLKASGLDRANTMQGTISAGPLPHILPKDKEVAAASGIGSLH
jgi:glutathionyl-hydroquinone reductase